MLVGPVNIFTPTVERTIEFMGYNTNPVIADGEMRNMMNLTSDEYPCLTQRKDRIEYEDTTDSTTWAAMNLQDPVAMIEKAVIKDGVSQKKLAVIDHVNGSYVFKYDGTSYPGLGLSADTFMVAINTRICFFPEKKWFNVQTSETGSLEATSSPTGSFTLGADLLYQNITFTSASQIAGFHAGDAITMYATLTIDGSTYPYQSIPVSFEIQDIKDNVMYIPEGTFLELDQEGAETGTLSSVRMERLCPDLAYVMEYNNRLWGVDNAHNEIRASKQGDPTNWNYYQGSSMDSYAATQGSDGEWTGLAAYSSHLLFFKEDCIHKVYGSKPSVYQIQTAKCYGLEKGSSKSVQIINDTVIYKSRVGIMAYDGGNPVLISEGFGKTKYKNVIAGADGRKYYASMQRSDGEYVYAVFDLDAGTWHIEDDMRATDFCYFKGNLIWISDGAIMVSSGTSEEIEWLAEFGPFDEYLEDKKVYSKMKMRLRMYEGSELSLYMKIDSNEWELVDTIEADEETAAYLPIIPRRCDKYAIKLVGTGRVKIESLTRRYRAGTDGRDVKL